MFLGQNVGVGVRIIGGQFHRREESSVSKKKKKNTPEIRSDRVTTRNVPAAVYLFIISF